MRCQSAQTEILERKIKGLSKENSQALLLQQATKVELEARTKEVYTLKEACDLLNGKCISLESQVQILEEKSKNQKMSLNNSECSFVNSNEMEALKNEIKQLQETINLEKTTRLLIEDKFQNVLREKRECEQRLANISTSSVNQSQNQSFDLEERKTDIREMLRPELEELDDEICHLRKKNDDLKDVNKRLKGFILEVQEENENIITIFKKKLDRAFEKLDNKIEIVDVQDQVIQELKAQLKNAENTLNRATSEKSVKFDL